MPYIQIDLLEFLHSGKLGPIALGMTRTQIETILGAPQNWGGAHTWWSAELQAQAYDYQLPYSQYPCWIYDAIEFHFGEQDKLFLIWCDHLQKLQAQGTTFHINRWIFAGPVTLYKEQVAAALQQVALSYTDDHTQFGPGFTLPCGVQLGYTDEDNQIISLGIYDYQHYRTHPTLTH